MTDGIEAMTTAALGLALDASALRQQAIATNIANANVSGYMPLTVDFDQQLNAARQTLEAGGRLDAWTLADVSPRLQEAGVDASLGLPPKVMLDMEVAHLAENGVRFQTLTTALSKHFSILALAAADGQR